MKRKIAVFIALVLAAAMLLSALNRKESRGAHCRSDCPGTNGEYRKTTVSAFVNGAVETTFTDIPEKEDNI